MLKTPPRSFKPGIVYGLRRGSPLVRGLRSLYLFNETLSTPSSICQDLNNNRFPLTTTGACRAVTTDGIGLSNNGSTSLYASNGNAGFSGNNFTVWMRAKRYSPGTVNSALASIGGSGARLTFIQRRSSNDSISYWDDVNSWSNSGVQMPATMSDVAWTVALGASADALKIYLNGSSILTKASMSAVSHNGRLMVLRNGAGTEPAFGEIAALAIWERILTPAEIMQLYRMGYGALVQFQDTQRISQNLTSTPMPTSLGSFF